MSTYEQTNVLYRVEGITTRSQLGEYAEPYISKLFSGNEAGAAEARRYYTRHISEAVNADEFIDLALMKGHMSFGIFLADSCIATFTFEGMDGTLNPWKAVNDNE